MWVIYFAFIILSSELVDAVSFNIDLGIQTGNLTNPDTGSIDARRFIMNVPQIVNDMIEKVKQFTLVQAQEYQSNRTAFKKEEKKELLRSGREKHGRHGRHKHENEKKKEEDDEKDLRQIFVNPQQIRNDIEITDFTKHIYKQAMKLFDGLKDRAEEPKIKREIDKLAHSYDEKFGEFVKQTQHHNIKTRLGRQKVIVNTLETSNRIVNRLVNYLSGRMGRISHNLRNKGSANTYHNDIKKKMEIENQHICQKFGICRSGSGFSTFLTDVLTTILSSNDKQIKIMADALTEALKYTHFDKIMDPVTARGFKDAVIKFESFDIVVFKAVFHILKNIIVNKNKPIEVVGAVDKRINKTVAFLELLDAFETALPSNEQNMLEWEDILVSMKDWRDDKRNDITEIMQIFVDHLRKASERFDAQTARNAEQNIVIILDYPDHE